VEPFLEIFRGLL